MTNVGSKTFVPFELAEYEFITISLLGRVYNIIIRRRMQVDNSNI